MVWSYRRTKTIKPKALAGAGIGREWNVTEGLHVRIWLLEWHVGVVVFWSEVWSKHTRNKGTGARTHISGVPKDHGKLDRQVEVGSPNPAQSLS